MKIRQGAVVLGPINWGTLKQRYQYMAEGISRFMPVIYAEPYASAAALAANPGLRNFYDLVHTRLRVAGPNLVVATPPALFFLPFQNRCAAFNTANQFPLALWLRHLLGSLGVAPRLVISHQFHFLMKRLLRPSVFVYDCSDNHAASPWYGKGPVGGLEERTARAADLVTCSAASLVEKMNPLASRTLLVRNAVDPRRFSLPFGPGKFPGRVAADPGARVEAIYVGTLSRWFDWEAVKDMVSTGRVRVHLVGPLLRDSIPPDIQEGDGLVIHGPADHSEIPRLMASMDVAVIPFAIDEVTRYTDPVKVYEYLAAGIPVVSTPLPEIARFAGLVRFSDAAGFGDAVVREALDDTPGRVAQRIAAAAANTWEVRVSQLLGAAGIL